MLNYVKDVFYNSVLKHSFKSLSVKKEKSP